jgi:hypothetical protein
MTAAAALAIVARPAAADPPIVVLVHAADGPALPALASELRVHAGRAIDVQTVERAEPALALAAHAADIVDARGATAVVWVATVPGDGVLVFAAGRWPGRALIELVRLPAATPPEEVERTVALKLAALLDAVLAAQPVAAALGLPVAAPVVGVPRAGAADAGPAFELGAGALATTGDLGWVARTSARAGYGFAAGAWTIAPTLAARWQPARAVTATPGRVDVQTAGGELGLRISRPVAPGWRADAGVHLALDVAIARGVTPDGRAGDASIVEARVGGEVGVRRTLTDDLAIAAAVVADVAATDQRFLLDGVPVADLGVLELGFVIGVAFR